MWWQNIAACITASQNSLTKNMQRLQDINLLINYCGRAKIEASLIDKQNIIHTVEPP